MNPYWIPGAKVLLYCNEGMSNSPPSSPLMHHKFVVFLERVEKLLRPKTNPDRCWKCNRQIEQPELIFWEDIYTELISSGEDLEEAESISQEWEVQCPHSKCDANNTFYNPKFVNQHKDLLPKYNPRYKPVAIWTGSFNFTYSAATKHLENGVFIDSPDIADIYFQEWAMNCIISEKFRL